jgi:DNA repair photolyase
MGLNKSTGNMYDFVTHTWNTVKGKCPHNCSYCYVKRWGNQPELHFDEKELKTDLGSGNFIFVGSGCDMWAQNIPELWILETLRHCGKFEYNKYLFQTKNPENIRRILVYQSTVCVTIETNRWYADIMRNSPLIEQRIYHTQRLRHSPMITIEPIIDFDLKEFVKMIKECVPFQVNIGADSGHNHLPEPSKDKILQLIEKLSKFTDVKQKSNLKRLL